MSTVKYPNEIYQELDAYIVGQQDCKEHLSILGYLFSVKAQMMSIANLPPENFPRLNCMLIGPTGSGKTEILYRLSKCLGVPYRRIDCTSLTPQGYKGINLDEAIEGFMYELKTFKTPGILLLDEFDKLGGGASGSSIEEFRVQTQTNLLDLLDGRYCTDPKATPAELEFLNGSLIVLSGAINHLFDPEREKETLSPGFLSSPIKNDVDLEKWRELLVDEGIMPEIVGRTISICKTNRLNSEELLNLIYSKKNSIMGRYYSMLPDIEFSFEEMKALADEIHDSRFGVRDLEGKFFTLVQRKILAEVDLNYVPPAIEELTNPLLLSDTRYEKDLTFTEYLEQLDEEDDYADLDLDIDELDELFETGDTDDK